MALGIVSRWAHHEATYAGLVLSRWATTRSIPVSWLPIARRLLRIDPSWDPIVARHYGRRFSDWAPAHELILWTHCPRVEQLRWCRQRGIRTAIFSLWQELDPGDQAAYQEADCVLSPSASAAGYLRNRWQIGRSLTLPWDLGLPQVCKDPAGPIHPPRLLLPLFDGAARRVEMTVLSLLDRLLQTHQDLRLSVAYTASVLAPYAYRRLQQLRHQHRPRVCLCGGVPPWQRPYLFQRHDLTVWPTQAESTGAWGLMSLAMGTPVAAFRFPPLTEFLHEQNSVFVQSQAGSTELGVAVCRPDYPQFEETLHTALKNPENLRTLQQTVAVGRERRLANFNDTLHRAIC